MSARHATILFVLLAGCGGASTPPPETAATETAPADGALNIPESEWVRMEIPEGAISVEMPGEPHRRVATHDAVTTYEVISQRGPVELFVGVEAFTAILSDSRQAAGLDAVANLFAERSRGAGRRCTPQPARAIEHDGHHGRAVLAVDCADLDGGTLAAAAFAHGSVLVSVVVVGRGVSPSALGAVFVRLGESIVLGPPPTWFAAIDTPITAPNLPGFSASLTRDVHSDIVQMDTGQVVARFSAEPLTGMATIVIVTTPSTLSAREYCRGLMIGGHLELTEQRDHFEPTTPLGYCEVRGRRAQDPTLYEIHDLYVAAGAVIQLSWTGPNEPLFLAGGDAQLAAMRASLRMP